MNYLQYLFWDARFQTEEEYDWLLTYAQVRSSLVPHLKATDRILVVGCGNSTFSADLYDDGFPLVVNIDFSQVVIDNMRALHSAARPLMTWECMDMTALLFPEDSFDVVLDKAAMDALLVDEGDCWAPEPRVVRDVHRMCASIARVLNPKRGAVSADQLRAASLPHQIPHGGAPPAAVERG